MVSVGSFGIDTPTGNQISRSRSQSADIDVLKDGNGRKVEGTSHGSEIKQSEEFFAGATLPTNTELEAVDAQNGTEIINAHGVNEQNDAYAKITKETTIYPGAES